MQSKSNTGFRGLTGTVSIDADTINVSNLNIDDLIVNESIDISNTTLTLTQYDNSTIGYTANQLLVKDSGITTAKIADSNITTAKVNDLAITTAKIADSNITTAKIADSNITTAKIADSNITTAKVNDLAITNAKIADNTIQDTKIIGMSGSKIYNNIPTNIYFHHTLDGTKLLKFDLSQLSSVSNYTLKFGTTNPWDAFILNIPAQTADNEFIFSDGTQTLNDKTLAPSCSANFSTSYITFHDQGDSTKKFEFYCGGNTTNTTRTLTIPDANGTLALTTSSVSSASTLSPGRNINGVLFDGSSNITIYIAGSDLTGALLASNITASSLTSFGAGANVATATALQTARTINGTSFNGTANITITAAAGTLTGATLASGITASSLTSFGAGANVATATALQTPRTINSVSFDGSANITITAAAGTLTGATLASGITASSLTSLGTAPTIITPSIVSSSDATKKFEFNFASYGTATTYTIKPTTSATSRTLTLPDSDGTACYISLAQTLTNKSIDAATNTITNISNSEIKSAAGIVDSKLATISTAGKVSNSATSATEANTASAIVARDTNGDVWINNLTANDITCSTTSNCTFGTWTATMQSSAGSGEAFTISSQYCYYLKTKTATSQYFYNCVCKITWSARVSSSNTTRISLPATVINTTGARACGSLSWVQNLAYARSLGLGGNSNTNYVNIFDLSNTTSTTTTTMVNSSFGSTGQIEFSVQFCGTS